MFNVNTENGLLSKSLFIPSPNCDLRPNGCDIDLLVIHNISLPPGKFEENYVQDFFCNQLDINQHPFFQEISHLKVSSHLYIRRDGTVYQFVPLHQRAWHAGESRFEGRVECNDFSIGIELEGTDELPYMPLQYQQLASITKAIMQAYPMISGDKIVGHSDIAPHRKTDPGPVFDWELYRSLISKNLANKQSSQ